MSNASFGGGGGGALAGARGEKGPSREARERVEIIVSSRVKSALASMIPDAWTNETQLSMFQMACC